MVKNLSIDLKVTQSGLHASVEVIQEFQRESGAEVRDYGAQCDFMAEDWEAALAWADATLAAHLLGPVA